jgi:hypothetical protein
LYLVRGAIFVYVDGRTRILSAADGGDDTNNDDNDNDNSNDNDKPITPTLPILIPVYARHNWGRAREYLDQHHPSHVTPSYTYPRDIDDDVVVQEWTDPMDIAKPLFFWNLNYIISPPPRMLGSTSRLPPLQQLVKWVVGPGGWISFQLLNVFWELDNWPVVLGLRGVLGGDGVGSWSLINDVWGRVGYEVPELRWVGRVKRKVEGWAEWLVVMVVLGLARAVGWAVGVRAVEKERTPVELWEEYLRKGV